jgi:hypothetical protein
MILFIYKWRKKRRFLTRAAGRGHDVGVVSTVIRVGVKQPLACKKTALFFECFPYVCPEPVLVKCSFLYINGAKSGVFRTINVRPVDVILT